LRASDISPFLGRYFRSGVYYCDFSSPAIDAASLTDMTARRAIASALDTSMPQHFASRRLMPIRFASPVRSPWALSHTSNRHSLCFDGDI